MARILAPALQQQLGQSVVVDNRGGASGSIGTGSVANGPADGYTFAVVFDTHAVNPALIPSLPFDTRKDLAPVALIGTGAMVLATHADSPFKTFGDVVMQARTGKARTSAASARAAWASWRCRCWRAMASSTSCTCRTRAVAR